MVNANYCNNNKFRNNIISITVKEAGIGIVSGAGTMDIVTILLVPVL